MPESRGLRRGEGLFACAAGRIATTAMAIALVALGGSGALAQDGAATGRIPTVTRLVRIMMDEEAQLGAAARGGNRQAIDALLGEDFEMRIGTAP